MKLNQKLSTPLAKIGFIFLMVNFTLLSVSCSRQSKKQEGLKSDEDSLIIAAEAFGQLHNEGLDYVLNYPDYDAINLYQRVQLSRSFCAINNVDSNTLEFTPEDIQNFYVNYDYENPSNIPQQLYNNQIISTQVQAYLDEAIQITNQPISFEQKILELSNLQQTINSNATISYNDKVISLFSVTTMKSSAIYWNSNLALKKSTVKDDCGNCIKNKKWKIVALDGLGAIYGLFGGFDVSVATAISVSATASCKMCTMCSGCGGANPWSPISCNNCPPPSQFDGANCYFGRPSSGNAFIMNGYYYWDDPTHQCKLNIWFGRYTQGTWDGAHCYVEIPTGSQFFIYQNGLYLKCN